jgi:hypothetical protein
VARCTRALTHGQVHDPLANTERLGPHLQGPCCLLAFNGLRIAEAISLDVSNLCFDGLFPVLRFVREGGRRGTAVLARATEAAVLTFIADRSAGPLFLTGRPGGSISGRPNASWIERPTASIAATPPHHPQCAQAHVDDAGHRCGRGP